MFERQVDRDRCAAIAGFITGTLRAEAGGYRGSDADGMLYMDGNAKAAGALLGAATVLDDSALAREALASFERVVLLCYKPGAGLAHYSDGVARVRGLLGDQIYTAGALLDAHDVSALEPYKMMAEELTHVAVRELWDEAGGGFFDRAGQRRRHRTAPGEAQAVCRQRRSGVDAGAAGAHDRRRRVPRARPKARCARRRRSWPGRDRSPRTTCSPRGSSPAGDKLISSWTSARIRWAR